MLDEMLGTADSSSLEWSSISMLSHGAGVAFPVAAWAANTFLRLFFMAFCLVFFGPLKAT